MSNANNNGNRNVNGPIRTHEPVSGPTRTEGGTPPTPPVPPRNISSVDSNAMRAARGRENLPAAGGEIPSMPAFPISGMDAPNMPGRVIDPVQVTMTHRIAHGPVSSDNTANAAITIRSEASIEGEAGSIEVFNVTAELLSAEESAKRMAVEGATVVCTGMMEAVSRSKMKSSHPASVVMQGATELVHTDIEFYPKFEKCKLCDDEECEPEIEPEEWFLYDETNQINGDFGLLAEQSFMICTKGPGMLFISEDGQIPHDDLALLAALAIKLEDHVMLGFLMFLSFAGDPVNVATGNFISARTDLKTKGQTPFEFQRFYNAMNEKVGALGRGWSHSFEIKLKKEEKDIVVYFEDGHGERYEKNESGGYDAPFGVFHKLVKTGIGYRLDKADQTSFFFNEKGQLITQKDEDDNELVFDYNNENLIKVSSVFGAFHFSYKDEKMVSMIDHTGRMVCFIYENDLLVKVVDALGNVRRYDYDEKGLILREVNPEENVVVENSYDEKDRVVRQSYKDGGMQAFIYDDEKRRTEFVQQDGNSIIYEHDKLYRTTAIVYPDRGEEQFGFNDDNTKWYTTDKIGNLTHYEYNDNGNVSKAISPLGHILEMTYTEKNKLKEIIFDNKRKLMNHYDKNDNLVEIEDALWRKTSFVHAKKSLPKIITQADGSQIQFVYDERNNVVELTNAQGITTYYEYDRLNRVVATANGNGHKTFFKYDEKDNIIEVKNAVGHIQSFTYNKISKVTSATDFNGALAQYEYNNLNKLAKVIDPLGRETIFGYDLMWNINHIIQPNGAEIQFAYDKCNRLAEIEKPDGSIIKYEYDKNGNRTKVIDEAGNETYLVYDAMSQLIEVSGEEGFKFTYTYNPEGQVTSMTDVLGNVVTLTYDEAGQLTQETNALGNSRFYTYTILGDIDSITDEAGRVTKHEYALGGQLIGIHHPDGTKESFEYDNNGNIIAHMDKIENKMVYEYDSLDRVIAITKASGGKKKYTYDPVGNVTSMVDELGNKTEYVYTLTGQLSKATDALGNDTLYFYDELDQPIEVCQLGDIKLGPDEDYQSVIKQNEANQDIRITKYERNKLGQVIAVTDALGQQEKYYYGLRGELIEKLDKDGYLTKYGYTKQGDINHIQYGDGREVKMSYNALRQLIEVQDWLGTTQIEVDALGRATKVKDQKQQIVEYVYGSGGERKQLIYPNGRIVDYEYDEALRLAKIKDGNQEINYVYDQFSRLTEKRFDEKTRTNYAYDDFGQLKELSHYRDNRRADFYYYDYDLLGNKTQIKKLRDGLPEENGTFYYKYDVLNRLERMGKQGKMYTREYKYDAFGNRSDKHEGGRHTRYTYNALNQLILSTERDVNTSYSYDKRGNLTEIYKNEELTHQYHFGALNRLEKTFNHERELGASYVYNGLGNRIGKMEGKSLEPVLSTTNLESLMIHPSKRIDDILDLTKPYYNLLERREDETQTSFVYDFCVLSAETTGEKQVNYLLDDVGSPIRITGGIADELYAFDEFGNVSHNNFKMYSHGFGFTGYQRDDIADTYYAQAREYSPQIGRFTAADLHWHTGNMIYGDLKNNDVPDMLSMMQSNNLYGYTLNNPVNYLDLDGKAVVTGTIILIVVVGAAVGGGANVGYQLWINDGCWDSIHWEEVVVSALAGGFAAGTGGAGKAILIPVVAKTSLTSTTGKVVVACLSSMAGGAAGNTSHYVGTQWINGDEIMLSDLFINMGVGAAVGLASCAMGLLFAKVLSQKVAGEIIDANVQKIINDMFGTVDISSAFAPEVKRATAQAMLDSIISAEDIVIKLTGKVGDKVMYNVLKNFGLDKDTLEEYLGNIDLELWGCE